nr:zinc finger, CCHC-type [Tanacetum cinerariifolium]
METSCGVLQSVCTKKNQMVRLGVVGKFDWEHPPLAVGTYTASGNSILAVGMPCAFYSQQNRALKEMINSMAVVRLPDLKRKTLGEKGIDCIFVGYVEHSKAYRFYVIEPNDSLSINSIIEPRDAIFDGNRFSSILRPKDIIPNSDESQRDDHSKDVPSEIPEARKGKRVQKAKSNGSDF